MINGHCASNVKLLNLTLFARNIKEPFPFNLDTKQISTKVLV